VFWSRYPLLRVTAFFALGLVVQEHFFLSPVGWWSLLLAATALAWLTRPLANRPLSGKYHGWWLLLCFFALGGAHFAYIQQYRHGLHQKPWTSMQHWQAVVLQVPREKPRSWAVPVRLEYCREASGQTKPLNTRAMLYLGKGPEKPDLLYGDRLHFKARLGPVPPVQVPSGFDYGRYLRRRGLAWQGYVRADQWQLKETGKWSLLRWAQQMQLDLVARIQAWPLDAGARQILSALLVGHRQALDPELREAFAQAGVVHVLAVSGLHTGIVYLMLHTLLWPFRSSARGGPVAILLEVAGLWLFAALTGLSPSVVRAATMFSFLSLGQALGRSTSVYNTLLASAFLLLLVHPYFLFSVGFQLSYAAVFGIVWLFPLLEEYFPVRHFVGRYPRDLIGVSLAAQAFTLPLSLYYFHQFPVLFLLANILVIPCVSLLMYWGLGCLLLSLFFALPSWLTVPLDWLLTFLQATVQEVARQPSALWRDLHLNAWEVLLLYLLLLTLGLGIRRARKEYLLAGLGLILLLGSLQLWEDWRHRRQLQVGHFAYRGQSWLAFYAGEQALLLNLGEDKLDSTAWEALHGAKDVRAYTVLRRDELKDLRLGGDQIGLPPALGDWWLVDTKDPLPRAGERPRKGLLCLQSESEAWRQYAREHQLDFLALPPGTCRELRP